MSASDAIEAKMQTVQASLRQERDKARRDYELSMERLGLLRTEVEATDAAVHERQKQLTTIVEETQSLQEKVPALRETVEQLNKEVRTRTTKKESFTQRNNLSLYPFSHYNFYKIALL